MISFFDIKPNGRPIAMKSNKTSSMPEWLQAKHRPVFPRGGMFSAPLTVSLNPVQKIMNTERFFTDLYISSDDILRRPIKLVKPNNTAIGIIVAAAIVIIKKV
jgi:hypothetical protein